MLIYNGFIYDNLRLFITIYEKVTSNCCPKILDISLVKIMKCKYFKTRTKSINKKRTVYNYCSLLKQEVPLSCYQEFDQKEYKQYKRLQAKSEYRYKPKKGKCSRYYNDVSIMPPSTLYFTKKTKGCEKHHIFGGVANRPKSEEYGLFVWMTEEQHRYYTEHPLENQKLKKIAQDAFIKHYCTSIDTFIDIFKKNFF